LKDEVCKNIHQKQKTLKAPPTRFRSVPPQLRGTNKGEQNFNFLKKYFMKIQLKEITIREVANCYKNNNEE
jgi:hypothetical protein